MKSYWIIEEVKFLNTVLLYAFKIMSALFPSIFKPHRKLEQCKVETSLFFSVEF